MATGNHLTVRDYFDQVLVGRTAARKAFSAGKVESSGGRTFHRLLTSFGNKQLSDNKYKPTSLTVADYLNNPVPVKCHYSYRILSASTAKQEAAADEASPSPANKPAEESVDGTTDGVDVKRKPQKVNESATSLPTQPGSHVSPIIEKSIHNAARKYNLPVNLLKGVIRAESNFQVNAVSSAGAQGLMQLMPGTAKELGVNNPFDIEQNIDGGARYLRKMLDSFGGDIKVALAAYNAGPGAVEKYDGKIPPYKETERYIDRVLKFSKQIA